MAKNGKTQKKAATKAPTKKNTKLDGTKLEVAQALVNAKDTGIGPGTWSGTGKFPTRTLKALELGGLAKSKEKKGGDGKKAAFFFPTAATAKAIQASA